MPFRSSPLAGDRSVSPLNAPAATPNPTSASSNGNPLLNYSAATRTVSPGAMARPFRGSGSHKRSETLPSLTALMAGGPPPGMQAGPGTSTTPAPPGLGPSPTSPAPPPGLLGSPVPSARPRFRPSHGKSASISIGGDSGVAGMFGGQGASAMTAAENRPSHLRHVRNRSSGGSFGGMSGVAGMIGTGATNGQGWRNKLVDSGRDSADPSSFARNVDSLGLNDPEPKRRRLFACPSSLLTTSA